MTKREKVLGSILAVLIVAAIALFGSQFYLGKIQYLDARIVRAERKIMEARIAAETSSRIVSGRPKKAWTQEEIGREAFLIPFENMARDAGWKVKTTVQRGGKNGFLLYVVDLEGPSNRWAELLDAIAAWDRPVVLEAVSGRAAGGGLMIAELELGYESR